MKTLIKFCDRKVRHHIASLPESVDLIPRDITIVVAFSHVLRATFFSIPILIGFYIAPTWTKEQL